jgi:tetratricopeptide (TPR) repeat protein
MSRPTHTALAAAVLAVLVAGASTAGEAQGFAPKPALVGSAVTGCSAFAPTPARVATTPGADAEAQQLIADAEAAALQGEHIAARDAFAKAAALIPGNARVAYYLGREHEALGENSSAVREYCRYLALQPTAPEADEVRGRIVRLTPTSELQRVEEAKANFVSAVALLRRRQYAAADSVFSAVASQIPAAPEPFFNRGLARAAQGDRIQAMQDFETYLEMAPQAPDRTALRDAMSQLPDRVYGPGQAFLSGVAVPGMGQMSTGRPLLGVLALGAVGAAVGFGLRTQDETETRSFTDPFGTPYTDTITVSRRPQLVAGLATAAAIWLGAALESIAYARGSRARAESIIAREGLLARRNVGIGVTRLQHGRVAIGLRIH